MDTKIKFLLIYITAIFFSCKIENKEKNGFDDLSIINTKDTTFIKSIDSKINRPSKDDQKKNLTIETSINKISLLDGESLIKVIKKPIFIENGKSGFPELIIVNADNTQKLTLLFYPGNTKNHVSYFILEQIDQYIPKANNVFNILDTTFRTNNNFMLGLSKEVVENKYISRNLKLKADNKSLSFILDDLMNPFLKEYNMPMYSAKYFFGDDNIINKIEFGFEFP
ncbi:hypothetical protein [Aquimarina pacifica]|uniref:hypothetical protein n=1 Tax=Aquimarina pacifica TaxID=1296415 RepID=UPI000471527F|nr:hypothetical protein [Aquimarina pacifica]